MEEMYGVLSSHLPAKLITPFKIRDYTSENSVGWLASIQFASAVNTGHLSDVHGLVTVQIDNDACKFTVVDIGTLLGLAHLILEAELR